MHSHPPQFSFVENEDGTWVNIPSKRICFVYDGNPRGYFDKDNAVCHDTNSLGFRGKDFSVHKPTDTFRLVFLGDSFTFGEGVWFRDTYSEQVSAVLNEKLQGKAISFESLNFGVGGYNTSQSLRLFRRIAMKYNPDMVILGYSLNDAEPTLFTKPEGAGQHVRRPRERFVPEGLSENLPPQGLLYKLRTNRLIWKLINNRKRVSQTVDYYRLLYSPENEAWKETREALRDISRLCKEMEIPIYVLCFPVLYQLSDDYPFADVHAMIGETVETSGAVFLDLLPYVKGLKSIDLWVHPTDQHPNEKTHMIAAMALAEQILVDERIQGRLAM